MLLSIFWLALAHPNCCIAVMDAIRKCIQYSSMISCAKVIIHLLMQLVVLIMRGRGVLWLLLDTLPPMPPMQTMFFAPTAPSKTWYVDVRQQRCSRSSARCHLALQCVAKGPREDVPRLNDMHNHRLWN